MFNFDKFFKIGFQINIGDSDARSAFMEHTLSPYFLSFLIPVS